MNLFAKCVMFATVNITAAALLILCFAGNNPPVNSVTARRAAEQTNAPKVILKAPEKIQENDSSEHFDQGP